MFQYISCYSLSIPTWLRSLTEISFNTSHVTLYRYSLPDCSGEERFQYISCYSLSYAALLPNKIFKMFQYISCYSLSMWIRPCDNRPWVSIHLMLLFIEGTKDTIDNSGKFQYISCYSLSGRHSKIRLRSYCFNTSHVTLYHQGTVMSLEHRVVSIHLMLLFIKKSETFLR